MFQREFPLYKYSLNGEGVKEKGTPLKQFNKGNMERIGTNLLNEIQPTNYDL